MGVSKVLNISLTWGLCFDMMMPINGLGVSPRNDNVRVKVCMWADPSPPPPPRDFASDPIVVRYGIVAGG